MYNIDFEFFASDEYATATAPYYLNEPLSFTFPCSGIWRAGHQIITGMKVLVSVPEKHGGT
jgi:hypothetical protein